jgi:hypothetical protein
LGLSVTDERALGVVLMLGGDFRPEDDGGAAAPTVIISYGFLASQSHHAIDSIAQRFLFGDRWQHIRPCFACKLARRS